jgi:glutathione peroxidase
MSSNMLRSRSSSLLPVTNSIGKSDSFTFNGSLRRGKKGGASPLLRFLVLIVFAGVLIGAGFVIARYGPNATIITSTKDLSASSVGGLTATEGAYMEARVEKRRRYGGARKQPKGGDDNRNKNRTDNNSSNGAGGASIDAEDTKLKEQFALDAAAKAEAVRLEQQQAQQAAAVQLQQQQQKQQLEAEAQQQQQQQVVPEPVQQHDDHQAAAIQQHIEQQQQHTEQQLDSEHQVVPTPTFATLYEDTMGAVDIHGNLVHFSDLRGHVTLIVNVASQCGYTDSNYQGLQQIYERYHDYGLEILAFPSNQFNNQEPGTEAEIEEFVRGRYGAAFPLMSKVDVNGAGEHPVFNFLKKYTPPLPDHAAGEPVSWNFNKFLLDKWGRPIKRYGSEMDYHVLETDVYNMLIQPYP